MVNSTDSCNFDIKLIETSINKIELFFERENISHNKIIVIMTDDSNIQCITEHFHKTNITPITIGDFKKMYSRENEPKGLIIFFPRIQYSQDVESFNVKFFSSFINLDGTLKLPYYIRNNTLFTDDKGIYLWYNDSDE